MADSALQIEIPKIEKLCVSTKPEVTQNNTMETDTPPVLPLDGSEDLKRLEEFFVNNYGVEPDFYARAPGRVNLIGEHIDYCGFSVCPMAIQQHVLIAVKKIDQPSLELINIDPCYEDFKCDLNNFSISVEGSPKWYQYFLCGVKGILDCKPNTNGVGMQAAVLGTIPPRAGLSSSSALVSAAMLATNRLLDLNLSKQELADLAAKSERFIGTQGGGMDQAIAFLATEGCAKLISFEPLEAKDVQLPASAVFVIANSLAEMNKAATSDFNQRVVEMRITSFIVAEALKCIWPKYPTLKSIQKDRPQCSAEFLRAFALEFIKEEPYTRENVMWHLHIREDQMVEKCLSENTKNLKEFKLKHRLLHVSQEALRVRDFERLCNICKKKDESEEAILYKLGKLLNRSHESLRTLYECSHPELDKIIELGKDVAEGARLTGAGWGGCTVALLSTEKADDYINLLKEKFYKDNPNAKGVDLDSVVFRTKPGRGAAIYVKQ